MAKNNNVLFTNVNHHSPCINCSDRQVGCHSVCDKYAEFRRDIDEQKARYMQYKLKDHVAKSYINDSIDRKKPWRTKR